MSFVLLTISILFFFALYHFYLLAKPQETYALSFLLFFFNNNTKAVLILLHSICLLSISIALFFGYYFYAIIPSLIILNLFFKSSYLMFLIHLIVLSRLLWFFSPLSDIYLMTSFFRSFTCLFSLVGYVFFIYHHKIALLWLGSFFRILLGVGTGDTSFVFAGGGLFLSSLETEYYTKKIHNVVQQFTDYELKHKRIPVRTNENLVIPNKKEILPSYSPIFYHHSYFSSQKLSSVAYDLSIVKNFSVDQGAIFTPLNKLTKELLELFHVQHTFSKQIILPEDKSSVMQLTEYHFNKEIVIMLLAINERFGPEVAQTFIRQYYSYDGLVSINNVPKKIDCYSPASGSPNPAHYEDKNADLVIIGNLIHDFSAHSTDKIIGLSANPFKNLPPSPLRDISSEIKLHVHDRTSPLVFEIEKGYTIPLGSFLAQLIKK